MKISINKAVVGDADSLTVIQKQFFERLYNIYQDEASPYLRGSDEIKNHIKNGTCDIYKILLDDTIP